MALTTEPKRCLYLDDLGITEEHLKDIPIKIIPSSSTLAIGESHKPKEGLECEQHVFRISFDANRPDEIDENQVSDSFVDSRKETVIYEYGKLILRQLDGRTPRKFFQHEPVTIDTETLQGRTWEVKIEFVFIFE